MHINRKLLYILLSLFITIVPDAQAAERTEAVEFFILIDKSLSMAEENRMNEVKEWVTGTFLEQILIPGDRLVLYSFYGETEKLLDVYIEGKNSLDEIRSIVKSIQPDGRFTDIGTALDTVKKEVEKKKNGGFPIILLLTDMIQEAPYSSRYQGMDKTFAGTYLAQDRIVPRGSWYEITVTTDGQGEVAKISRELYNIIVSEGTGREIIQQAGSQ